MRQGEFTYWLRDNGPAILFMLFTATGGGFIVFTKMIGTDPFLTTGFPVLLMFSYAVIHAFTPILKVHNEQTGDNLYYMGFLFTLTSLGVSLYLFHVEDAVTTIIQNFGVAVFSTIAGVLLRIMFAQTRRDPIDIERNMRHELAEMSRRVRTELDSSSREFSSYRRSSSQMLSEGFEEIARQAQHSGEMIQTTIKLLSTEAIRPIQETADKLAILVEANNKLIEERGHTTTAIAQLASDNIGAATEKLTERVDDLARTVGKVIDNLNHMQSPADRLRIELQPIAGLIKEMVEAQTKFLTEDANAARNQESEIRSAMQPVTEIAPALKAMSTSFDGVMARFEAATSTIGETAQKLDKVKESVSKLEMDFSDEKSRIKALELANVKDLGPEASAISIDFPEERNDHSAKNTVQSDHEIPDVQSKKSRKTGLRAWLRWS